MPNEGLIPIPNIDLNEYTSLFFTLNFFTNTTILLLIDMLLGPRESKVESQMTREV
jgi:hypothetical protein